MRHSTLRNDITVGFQIVRPPVNAIVAFTKLIILDEKIVRGFIDLEICGNCGLIESIKRRALPQPFGRAAGEHPNESEYEGAQSQSVPHQRMHIQRPQIVNA